jgi:hypothetical protein
MKSDYIALVADELKIWIWSIGRMIQRKAEVFGE